MKVGILTQSLKNNYGGLLQNYALQQVLIKMGHEPITIDWDDKAFLYLTESPLWKKKLLPLYFKWLHFKLRMTGRHVHYTVTPEEESVIGANNNLFTKRFIYATSKAKTEEELRDYALKYKCEVLIVGSDQVWRPRYNEAALKQMFLEFAQNWNIKRIAYAASFGASEWEYTSQQTEKCSGLAKLFDLITVREASAVELCKKYFGLMAEHVLDPTMLLDVSDYLAVIDTAQYILNRDCEKKLNNINILNDLHKGQLFYYLLDPTPTQIKIINDLSNTLGIKAYTVMPKYNKTQRTKAIVKKNIEACVFPGPIEWLKGFRDASMVLCDSFHGCVFSIIFNKPFWVFANEDRGLERFTSLLQMFGLEDRFVRSDNVDAVDFLKPIDWERVNNIRKEWINKSMALLESAGL